MGGQKNLFLGWYGSGSFISESASFLGYGHSLCFGAL